VHAQRRHRERSRAVRRALPELVDLLALASTAGLSLPVAHPLVAGHVPAPVGTALRAAHDATRAGRPRADALVEHLAPLGERSHALAQVLGDHLRYGVPLLPALERTGLELRLDRRRAAELEARRVPVRLLAPLVTCVLPAFALLTVVPLLAASLEALPT
jgi:tight adherence protein C